MINSYQPTPKEIEQLRKMPTEKARRLHRLWCDRMDARRRKIRRLTEMNERDEKHAEKYQLVLLARRYGNT